ncbi:MAG: flagellar biosynthetic protein FliR [Verrucomicrobiota bacterium]
MIFSISDISLGFLVLCRLGPVFFLFPVFSSKVVPTTVKLALALFFTMIFVGVLPLQAPALPSVVSVMLSGFAEILVGSFIGMASRLTFWIIELAGFIISQEIGLMMSSAIDPITNQNSSTIASVLYYFGIVIVFVTQTHHDLIRGFAHSLMYFPVGIEWLRLGSLKDLVYETSRVFHLGVLMAAPFISINMLINLTFAVLGRAAPKMNVFMVSFAVRILAGFFLLTSASILLAHYIERELGRIVPVITKFLGG